MPRSAYRSCLKDDERIDWKKVDLRQLDSLPPALTVLEVGKLLRVSATFVGLLIEEGSLDAIDLSSPPHSKRCWRILRSSFIEFVRKRGLVRS